MSPVRMGVLLPDFECSVNLFVIRSFGDERSLKEEKLTRNEEETIPRFTLKLEEWNETIDNVYELPQRDRQTILNYLRWTLEQETWEEEMAISRIRKEREEASLIDCGFEKASQVARDVAKVSGRTREPLVEETRDEFLDLDETCVDHADSDCDTTSIHFDIKNHQAIDAIAPISAIDTNEANSRHNITDNPTQNRALQTNIVWNDEDSMTKVISPNTLDARDTLNHCKLRTQIIDVKVNELHTNKEQKMKGLIRANAKDVLYHKHRNYVMKHNKRELKHLEKKLIRSRVIPKSLSHIIEQVCADECKSDYDTDSEYSPMDWNEQRDAEVKSQEILMAQLMEQQRALQKRNKTLVVRLKAMKSQSNQFHVAHRGGHNHPPHGHRSSSNKFFEGNQQQKVLQMPDSISIELKSVYDHYLRNPMLSGAVADVLHQIQSMSSRIVDKHGANDYRLPEFGGRLRINSAQTILVVMEDILVQRQRAIAAESEAIEAILCLKEEHERSQNHLGMEKKRLAGDIRKLTNQLTKYVSQIRELVKEMELEIERSTQENGNSMNLKEKEEDLLSDMDQTNETLSARDKTFNEQKDELMSPKSEYLVVTMKLGEVRSQIYGLQKEFRVVYKKKGKFETENASFKAELTELSDKLQLLEATDGGLIGQHVMDDGGEDGDTLSSDLAYATKDDAFDAQNERLIEELNALIAERSSFMPETNDEDALAGLADGIEGIDETLQNEREEIMQELERKNDEDGEAIAKRVYLRQIYYAHFLESMVPIIVDSPALYVAFIEQRIQQMPLINDIHVYITQHLGYIHELVSFLAINRNQPTATMATMSTNNTNSKTHTHRHKLRMSDSEILYEAHKLLMDLIQFIDYFDDDEVMRCLRSVIPSKSDADDGKQQEDMDRLDLQYHRGVCYTNLSAIAMIEQDYENVMEYAMKALDNDLKITQSHRYLIAALL
eukprot:903838_1